MTYTATFRDGPKQGEEVLLSRIHERLEFAVVHRNPTIAGVATPPPTQINYQLVAQCDDRLVYSMEARP